MKKAARKPPFAATSRRARQLETAATRDRNSLDEIIGTSASRCPRLDLRTGSLFPRRLGRHAKVIAYPEITADRRTPTGNPVPQDLAFG